MHLPLNQILLGDCLDVLRTLPDASIDSVVADVPYGLGNKEPTPDDIFMYVLGCTLDTGGDFMGRDWEIPSVAVWREVFRVLKPGGHVLSFGGTRTFDLISIGIRMAGFESRDTIGREYPVLRWLQGQGMPKSMSIGKAIDKKLGKKRTEVVGVKPGHEEFVGRGNNSSVINLAESGPHAEGFARPWMNDPEKVEKYPHQYAPASDEAKQWESWGTGLKPAWEPILVFRKPFTGTLASNVLKHGTGGLNIDATRVQHASKEDFEAHKKGVDAVRARGGSRDGSWKNASDLSGANEVTAAGRWPSNTLFEHSPGCRKVGTKRVKTGVLTSGSGRSKESYESGVDGSGWKGQAPGQRLDYAGDDGCQEVDAWECVDEVVQTTWASLQDGTSFCLQQASPETWIGVLMLLQARLDSHNAGTESMRSSAPAREPSYSGLQGFRGDCPVCSRFCDELLRQIEDAGRDSPRRLGDALEPVLGLVRSRSCNLPCRHDDLPSSSDADLSAGVAPCTPSSSTSPASGSGRASGRRGKGQIASSRAEQRDSNPPCSTERACGGGRGTPSRSGDIGAQLLQVLVSSMNAAAAYIPLSLRVVERKSICPVRALDEQSGDRPSTLTGRADPNGSHEHPGTEMNPNSTFLGERTHLSRVYADAGGASRFFTQFEGECAEGCPGKELHDQGVAMGSHAAGNKGETNHVSGKGYGGAFKPMTNNPDYHADEGGVDRFFAQFEAEGEVPFKYIAKANRKEAGCGEFEVQHVTLKPLALMRWLVRLVTPKGGVVLDPYCGSGSTCHAAVLEGMHFIGIERDEKNHAEAVKRLEIVLRRDQERKDEEETFAFAMGRTS